MSSASTLGFWSILPFPKGGWERYHEQLIELSSLKNDQGQPLVNFHTREGVWELYMLILQLGRSALKECVKVVKGGRRNAQGNYDVALNRDSYIQMYSWLTSVGVEEITPSNYLDKVKEYTEEKVTSQKIVAVFNLNLACDFLYLPEEIGTWKELFNAAGESHQQTDQVLKMGLELIVNILRSVPVFPFNPVIYHRQKEAFDRVVTDLVTVIEIRDSTEECHGPRHPKGAPRNTVFTTFKQTRSSDEPPTVFNTCSYPGCGHKW